MVPLRYAYCPRCGGTLRAESLAEQDQPKCTSCQFVFYQNPIVGVAAILLKDRKVLLGERNGSYAGLWCLPCGYVDWKEEIKEACRREFKEETGLIIETKKVYAVHSNFHNSNQHTVGVWYLVEQIGGTLAAADDLSQVSFFNYNELPELAFPTDRHVLDQLKAEGLLK